MKKLQTLFILFISAASFAQNTGSITGKLTDKEFNNEPLPFANVLIKGTATGTTSNIDGLYELNNLEVGSYTIVYSFVGYETQEIQVDVLANKTTTLNVPMNASAASLDEVVITTTARKESEVALLLDQKKAVEIKESIGSEQLSRLGVSNASAATTKISGVSKSKGSGQLYVRGLGDRFLTTTLNGLPIPSDNIDKKNLDLGLFPSKFIQNVSVSKTFAPKNSADQASGNIDITSKEVTKSKEYGFSLGGGINTNVGDVFNNFKTTANNSEVNFGIYSKKHNLNNALTQQNWHTQRLSSPINHSFSFNAGGIIDVARKLRLSFSGGQSVSHEYREGVFANFDTGSIRDSVPDGDNIKWRRTINTVGMLHSQYKVNDNNRLSFNSFLINKVFEETYEAGRAGGTEIFEELDGTDEGYQFVRDQNLKNTLLSITQLIGKHKFSEDNNLEWAVGFNYVSANEPMRIRNEVNILNDDINTIENEQGVIQLGRTGAFQQRKSSQDITDNEVNARIEDKIVLKKNEDDDAIYKVSFGGNFRAKQRDFKSQLIGVEETSTNAINPTSIDAISDIFTQNNFNNGLLQINLFQNDIYEAELISYAGYVDFIGVFNRFTAEVGLRYQSDEIDVNFDVANYTNRETGMQRIGTSDQSYNRIYPAINLKYDLTDKLAVRLASSLSQTLPEFKEIAPFQYVSPENRVTRGNPNIEASKNLNIDLKFELFPSTEELVSLTAFYKRIEDPINRVQERGASGSLSYFNSGKKATVFGVEIEGRVYVIKKKDSLPNIKLTGNISYTDHKQDLKEIRNENGDIVSTFRYNNKNETGLEGASDWVTNASVTFNTGNKHPYEFTLSGNYASDKIYALGSPGAQTMANEIFDEEIIEHGVVTLDFIFNKEINKHWSVGLTAKNLLNPTIKRTQFTRPTTTGIEANRTVLSYTTGTNTSLTINYKF